MAGASTKTPTNWNESHSQASHQDTKDKTKKQKQNAQHKSLLIKKKSAFS
jgi:hypothetical protein